METSAQYPANATPAIAFLKRHSNDIAIFVEDTSAPNVWLYLLKRFLPNGVKLKSVTGLGSRNKVEAACRKDQADNGKKRLYIVDADLDLLTGEPELDLKHYYRLNSYCMENYLLQQDALVELATALRPDLDPEEAEKLRVANWFDENTEALKKLFLIYAVCKELSPQHTTVGMKYNNLCTTLGSAYTYCSEKVNERYGELYNLLVTEHGYVKVDELIAIIQTRMDDIDVERFASGKDYLLPPILNWMKTVYVKGQQNPDTIKVLLAQRANSDVDPVFKVVLQEIFA